MTSVNLQGAIDPALLSALSISGALSVDTINEYTSAAGVTIDGLLIKDYDLDMSAQGTGTYDLILKDAVADALSIRRATTDMIVFDTSTPQITITPNLVLAGTLVGPASFSVKGGDATSPTLQFMASQTLYFMEGASIRGQLLNSGASFYLWSQSGDLYLGSNTAAGKVILYNAAAGAGGIRFQSTVEFDEVGGVNVTKFKVAKVTMAHTGGLFDAAGLTDSATIWTQPVNSRLIAVMMKMTAQFVAVGLTNLTVTMGGAGDNDGLLTTTGNLTSDAVNTEYENAGAYHAAFTEGIASKRANASGTKAWIAYATATGANLDTTSAGSLDFYFLYEEA